LLSSPQGICFCHCFCLSPSPSTNLRVPHPSRTCDGWDDKCSLSRDAVAFALLLPTAKTVISTEAAHSLTVSSAAEKSASLPKQHLSHCRVFAVAVALIFVGSFGMTTAPTTLPKTRGVTLKRGPKGEAAHSITFVVGVIFLLSFSAKKSHVKPRNHLTPYHPTTSEWHFSYVPNAILDI
jgi:hypothetical protein